MRLRTYGLIVLALVGIIPLGAYGLWSVQRSQDTSEQQVRNGNRLLADAIARRIDGYIACENRLIGAIGEAALQNDDPQRVLDSYTLGPRYSHIHDPVIVRTGPDDRPGDIIGVLPASSSALYRSMAAQVLSTGAATPVFEPAGPDNEHIHSLVIARPIEIVGRREGAIVARYDLVGLWGAIHDVHVARTGFVQLLTRDGLLLAHGRPEGRRRVFNDDTEENRRLIAAGEKGQRFTSEIYEKQLLVATAQVTDPGLDWVVVIEQEVREAFADVEAMKRKLWLATALVLALAVGLGLLVGSHVVRALERLLHYTRTLPEDLQTRITTSSRLVEVRALAHALNTMAADLIQERDAARARERLSTFARVAAGLAHDLRVPLESVRGACDMINADPDDAAARRLLGKVSRRDLPRLKRYVDDLQRLAQGGNLGLEYGAVDPADLVRDVCSEMTGTPKWSGVEFATSGTAAPAIMDQNLVRRAILNLAGNAADACLERGPGNTVTIEVADSAQGDAVEIRITDTGPGIPPDRLERLKTADFESTKRTTGVGLGLGVARQIATAHGGALIMSSEVGVGSTFTLRLPHSASSSRAGFSTRAERDR